jgi:peptide/nickel transport system permease protein
VLSGLAIVFSFGIGIILGLIQAERVGGRRDRWLGRVLLLLYSVPDFWLGLVMLLLFAYRLPLLPAGGIVDPVMHDYLSAWGRMLDRLAHLALPVATLTLVTVPLIARYQRAALLNALPSDWMRTALAKGLSWRGAVRRHALRNALLPTITLAGLALPSVAAGTVFVEKVFSWPGMGLVTVNAIAARDYPLLTAGVMAISVLVVVGALLADLAVAAVDPRIRVG